MKNSFILFVVFSLLTISNSCEKESFQPPTEFDEGILSIAGGELKKKVFTTDGKWNKYYIQNRLFTIESNSNDFSKGYIILKDYIAPWENLQWTFLIDENKLNDINTTRRFYLSTEQGVDQYNITPFFILNFNTSNISIEIGKGNSPSEPDSLTKYSLMNHYRLGDKISATFEFSPDTITITVSNKTNQESRQIKHPHIDRGSMGKWRFSFLNGICNFREINLVSSILATPKRTVFIGNSITSGFGSTSILKRYPNLVYNNQSNLFELAAAPSIKSDDVIEYIDEVINAKPKYCVVGIGFNDRAQNVPLPNFESNYRTIIVKLKQNGVIPIALKLVPYLETSSLEYNKVIDKIAQEESIKAVDLFTPLRKESGIGYNELYTDDRVHPNDLGHAIIAEIIKRSCSEIL